MAAASHEMTLSEARALLGVKAAATAADIRAAFRAKAKSAHPDRPGGDDLWLTVHVTPRTLDEGGRVPVVTPIGRRILWVTKKAGERRLVRAPGLGLPARGRHPEGALFVRLAPKTGPLDSAARNLIR